MSTTFQQPSSSKLLHENKNSEKRLYRLQKFKTSGVQITLINNFLTVRLQLDFRYKKNALPHTKLVHEI